MATKKGRSDLAALSLKDEARLEKIRRKQELALNELNERQDEFLKGESPTAQDRLDFLIAQTAIYSQPRGPKKSQKKGETKAPKSEMPMSPNKRNNRMKEKEEDARLLKEELVTEDTGFITHWTQSPPFIHNGTMRPYQLDGLNWMIGLYDNGISGILADEMGLGKTLQTLAFLAYLKNVRGLNKAHVIIVPKSTLPNWLKEIKKWTPSLTAFGLLGTKEDRAETVEKWLVEDVGKWDICVTTYEVAIIEKSALKKINWGYICIDEAHRIKNDKSQLSGVVRMFNSTNRLLITGTPLQNNLHELWSLLNFLLPTIFSSASDWQEWFGTGGTTAADTDGATLRTTDVVHRLHSILRPLLLRRVKKDVAKDLPAKTEIKLFVQMTALQREWYKKILSKDIDAINSGSGPKTRIANIVMQLRKVCNHPYLFPNAEPGPPFKEGPHLYTAAGKMAVLDKLLGRLQEKGSRVLIFSQMTRMLDILEDYCTLRGWQYCRIDGSTDHEEREGMIDEYNAEGSEKFIFLLSTRAGGLGINLATADTVILYDSDWNPQVDLQAQDRAHRIGQTKPVSVYRFVTEHAIEEKIVERAEAKLRLDAIVIQQGRLMEQHKALSRSEMLNMIRYGADDIFQAKEAAELTDEDIDAIIERGKKLTEDMKKKFESEEVNNKLLDWANTDPSARDEGSWYTFEGVDYKGTKIKTGAPRFIDMGNRSRSKTTNYNEAAYYRSALGISAKPSKPKKARPPKQLRAQPFQFFPPRLYDLLEKETAKWSEMKEAGETPPLNADGQEVYLSAAEENEKVRLAKKGFSNWNRRDYSQFTRASADYGRDAIDDIAAAVEGKTKAEVVEYHKKFWKAYKTLPDWEKVLANVEKGEAKIERQQNLRNSLITKVESTLNPWYSLTIPYSKTAKSSFSKEEDVFLLCATYKFGYGEWDAVKAAIADSWQFRFDWYFQSRSTVELNRRVDILLRMLVKEQESHNVNVSKHMDNRPKPLPAKPTPTEPVGAPPVDDEKPDEKDDEAKEGDDAKEAEPKSGASGEEASLKRQRDEDSNQVDEEAGEFKKLKAE